MTEIRFKSVVTREGEGCFLPLPFDPKPVFGRIRAPVVVTVGSHSWRSTIAAMGGPPCLPLRRSNREAAGVAEGEEVEVLLVADTAPRTVDLPPDLEAALTPAAQAGWDRLSYSHQREHAEAIKGAKRPETRARRVAKAVEMLEGKG